MQVPDDEDDHEEEEEYVSNIAMNPVNRRERS